MTKTDGRRRNLPLSHRDIQYFCVEDGSTLLGQPDIHMGRRSRWADWWLSRSDCTGMCHDLPRHTCSRRRLRSLPLSTYIILVPFASTHELNLASVKKCKRPFSPCIFHLWSLKCDCFWAAAGFCRRPWHEKAACALKFSSLPVIQG